jgi:transglutaminase-like putative cysteine protease/predicted glutamine amidotransferase
MPNLLAMSFEGQLAPSFNLRLLEPGKKPPDGWGIGFYPGGEPSASVIKEPAPPSGSIRGELVRAWESFASSIFIVHLRTATWGPPSHANTQPFSCTWGGRDWLFAHSGSLKQRLEVRSHRRFRPVGSTDSELIFFELMSRIAAHDWNSLGEIDPAFLSRWFSGLNPLGSLSSVISDGHDLVAYADANDEGSLHLGQILPPYEKPLFSDDDLDIDLARRGIKSRKGLLISSTPLHAHDDSVTWRQLPPGHLLVVRQGAILAEIPPPSAVGAAMASAPVSAASAAAAATDDSPPQLVARPTLKRPARAETKRVEIVHRTVYKYTSPVERSTHLLRLMPVHDHLQNLVAHEMKLSVDGQRRDFIDVFGNRARRVLIDTPYSELAIEARSQVELLDTDPLNFRPLHARTRIPLVWMPWQGQVLQPYLLPPELPETELDELAEYAMTFVERNDFDLLDTLLDLNTSIFQEYEYSQGTTTIYTTPYEVYSNRRGVCQDFTNLFICLARLLGVPARYVCGYIYTGPKNPNQRQSEASHAWLQLYLPEVGWKGFDPTNGVLTQTDHVRVAVGRRAVDATPTSGTIFLGGGGETLTVDVRVEVGS